MKNQKSLNRSIFIGLTMFTLSFACLIAKPQSANAQEIDLKQLRAQSEAESIKKFTDSLTLFYNLVSGATAQTNNKSVGAGLKEKGERVRAELTSNVSSIESFVAKLKTANRFNDQFDADVNALIGSNKVKGRLAKAGGARKLLASVLNSTSVNNLKKDVGTAASILEVTKSEDLCRFVAIGIVAEAVLQRKATTANDKFYEQIGCNK